MPLTDSIVAAADIRSPREKTAPGPPGAVLLLTLTLRRSARFLGAVALGDLLLLGVLLGRSADHRLDDLRVCREYRALLDHPPLAVPGVDPGRAAAMVIDAGGADRRHEALEAELLDEGRVDVQVLEAPAHFLALQRLLAVLDLRALDGFHRHHRADHAAVVEDFADFLFLAGALALVVHVFENILVHGAMPGRRKEGQRVIALRTV